MSWRHFNYWARVEGILSLPDNELLSKKILCRSPFVGVKSKCSVEKRPKTVTRDGLTGDNIADLWLIVLKLLNSGLPLEAIMNMARIGVSFIYGGWPCLVSG